MCKRDHPQPSAAFLARDLANTFEWLEVGVFLEIVLQDLSTAVCTAFRQATLYLSCFLFHIVWQSSLMAMAEWQFSLSHSSTESEVVICSK